LDCAHQRPNVKRLPDSRDRAEARGPVVDVRLPTKDDERHGASPTVAQGGDTAALSPLWSRARSRLELVPTLHTSPAMVNAEGAMVAVTIQTRVVSLEAVPELCRILAHTIERTQTPGWLHGRCFIDSNDGQHIFVYEEWAGRQSWDAWFISQARQAMARQLVPLAEGEPQIDIYEEV
jgi:quinol monooxygenase YgiN